MTIPNASFKDPLILSLGELTNWTPNKRVSCRDTIDPICLQMGITVAQFGNQTGSNKPWVELWIGVAFSKLIEEGYADRVKKGVWSLTQAGVCRAKTLLDQKILLDQKNGNPMTNTVTVPSVPDVAPKGSATVDLLSFEFLPPVTVPYAGGDSHLTLIAISQSPCFGNSYQATKLCLQCPLADRCGDAFMESISEVVLLQKEADETAERARKEAERVKQAAERANAAKAAQATQPAPQPAPSPVTVTSSNGQSVIVPKDGTLCTKCKQVILKGATAIWIRNPPGGMFHTSCVGAATATTPATTP